MSDIPPNQIWHKVSAMISPTMAATMTIAWGFLFILTANSILSQPAYAQSENNATRVIPIPTTRPTGEQEGTPSFIPPPAGNTEFPKKNAILSVNAVIDGSDEAVQSGMIWRVFADQETPEGKLTLIGTSSSGKATFDLPAGYYYIHASFGYAEQIKRIRLTPPFTETTFNIAAGGLRLNAAFRQGDFIPAKDLSFEIAKQQGDELKTILTDVAADEFVRLGVGEYHVTSKYGDVNSEVTATVRINSGKLTELTLYQRGAEITLRLVSESGGEALADTSWTILTPGGDPVANTVVSAFPSFVLAAGDYVAFARHEGENYSASFTVESGAHRDVEVLLSAKN